MELVHAPVPELRGLLTDMFQEWAEEGRSCALSGDGTALLFLPALRAAQVDWSKITLFWTDEHAVPADDPESNYGIAERMLLGPLGAKAPRAIRMPADTSDLGQAAQKYDEVLTTELNSRPLDLAIVGVGEDGHVCALFPGGSTHAPLPSPDGLALKTIAVEDAPRPPRRRLSLTLPFLLQTRRIWLIAVGPRKLPVLQAALSKTQRSTPLDLVLQQAGDVTIFTDQVIRRR